MFARFFVDRPVFATVLSLVIVIIGLVALMGLPIAQYPEVVPPTVQITATYPGASAKVVAETVAAPIEQEINGVENMLYMLSKSTNDGQLNLDVTFRVGTNLVCGNGTPADRIKSDSRSLYVLSDPSGALTINVPSSCHLLSSSSALRPWHIENTRPAVGRAGRALSIVERSTE